MTEQNKKAYKSPILRKHGTIAGLTQVPGSLSCGVLTTSEGPEPETESATPETEQFG